MRSLRRARGLTQDELARATGVSRSAVAQWETGRAGFSNRIVRVADVLGVSVRALRRPADTSPAAVVEPAGPSTREETTLLSHFRELGTADRACLLLIARRLAAASGD